MTAGLLHPATHTQPGRHLMKLAVGSILSMTPATGTVTFTTPTEQRTFSLIGYAVVVTYLPTPDDEPNAESELTAVFLDSEGQPETMFRYARDCASIHATWSVSSS